MNLAQAIRFASDVFGNPAFVFGVCLVLFFAAFGIWLYASHRSRTIRRDANGVLSILADDTADPRLYSERLFSLEQTPLVLRVQAEIRDLWQIKGRYHRVPSGNTETLDHTIHEYIDTRTLDAWPNVFVGIGLLFTFIGLALSLWNASQGAASGDIAVVKQSVTALLEFSAVKFTTSLAALLCSIVLGVSLRVQRNNLERLLRRVELVLGHALPRLTLEAIAVYKLSEAFRTEDNKTRAESMLSTFLSAAPIQLLGQHIEEIREQAHEQTLQLTSFNSDLAIQLSAVLDSKLQPMLAGLADRLETALREMGGSLGQTNEQALKTLLESFLEELRGATKSDSAALQLNMQQLAEELGRASRDLSEHMGAVFSGLESTGERFASVLSEASASFRSEIGQAQAGIGSGLSEAVATLTDHAIRSARESESMLASIGAGAQTFRANVEEGATSFVGELDRGVRSVDQVVERLGQTVSALGTIVDRAGTFAEISSARAGERITELRTTIGDVNVAFRRVSEAAEPFANAAAHVRGAIDLLRLTQSSVETKVAALQAAAESIAASSNTLEGTLGRDITRMTDGLNSTTDRLTHAIEAVAAESESAGTRLTEVISNTLSEYERRFVGIDEELQAAIATIIASFTQTYEDMRNRIDIVDQQMAQSVNKLASFNVGLAENAADITEAIAQLPRALAGA